MPDDFDRYQDNFGQLPSLQCYINLLLCFPVPDGAQRPAIVNSLNEAATQLVDTFPWLAGKVVRSGASSTNSGVFTITPYAPGARKIPFVAVKDYSDTFASYSDIIAAKGPMSILDGSILAPTRGFPEPHDPEDSDDAPILLMQATFVHGGLLLNIGGHHNTMDFTGVSQCVRCFATLLRGEALSAEAVAVGNRDRKSVVRLLGEGEEMLDHTGMRKPAESSSESSESLETKRAPAEWRYSRFPAAKLAELKAAAQKNDKSVSYITTDDALVAFIWKRLASIRLKALGPNAVSRLTRAAETRRAVGVGKEYMGHMVSATISPLSFQQLAEADLGVVAVLLRTHLNAIDEYAVRSLVTMFAREQDKSKVMYGGKYNPDTDLLISSWAGIQMYGVGFGLLGKPELVRREAFLPVEGLVYFMPKDEAGHVDAAICLNAAESEALAGDPEWAAVVEHIG